MDFWDLTRMVFRRWYVSAPMLLLTVGGATWTVTGVEPDYIATAHVQLVPPATILQNPVNQVKTPTTSPRNPWLDLGLGALCAAGAVTVQDQEVIKQLEAAGLSSSFTVTQGNQVPLVSFEVVGQTKAQAQQTVDFLTTTFNRNVVALQDAYGAPKTEKISTRRLDLGNNVSESNSKVKRALVAVAGAGVLLTAALTIALDAFLRRRGRKRAESDGAAVVPGPEPKPLNGAAAAVPPQRNGSTAPEEAVPAPGERSEPDRTVIIRQPIRARVRNGRLLKGGSPNGDEADNASERGRSTPPGESTIVLPQSVYGSVYGRRGDNKDRQ